MKTLIIGILTLTSLSTYASPNCKTESIDNYTYFIRYNAQESTISVHRYADDPTLKHKVKYFFHKDVRCFFERNYGQQQCQVTTIGTQYRLVRPNRITSPSQNTYLFDTFGVQFEVDFDLKRVVMDGNEINSNCDT
jgi:hypothetical protein